MISLGLVCAGTTSAAETLRSGDCTVRILGPADTDEIPDRYQGVVRPTIGRHRDIIEQGLKLMPPITCAAVRRAVFVDDARYVAEDGWVLPGTPDLVFLNYTLHLSREKATQSFVHESTHAADQLLNSQRNTAGILDSLTGDDNYPQGLADADDWPESAQALAKRIVNENRLGAGLRQEWVRIHRNFQSFGRAGDFGTAGNTSSDTLASNGFTSAYGRSQAGEDIAEFASWILTAPLFAEDDSDYKNAACQAMQAHDFPTVPIELAAVFTKVNFLLSSGLITRAAYERCVGKLSMPGNEAGIFVYGVGDESSELKRDFKTDVRAGIAMDEKLNKFVFTYSASGTIQVENETVATIASLRLVLDSSADKISNVTWPRGIYNLKALGNRFELQVPSKPHLTFVSIDGVVLISHASNRRIEGSMFLTKAIRVHSVPPVPQTGLPLRFVIRAVK